jgi:Carboxypeptidase regulatory-like domain
MPTPTFSRTTRVHLVLVFLALASFVSRPARAQVAGATLSGTVSDQTGAVIANSQVTIKNVATGVTRTVPADAAGFYTTPNLLPGTYEITVSASGFSTEVRSGITLTVGAQQVLNITMKVGQTSQRVEVKGEAPTVELASATLGGVVGANTVVELPLNGRSWTDLAPRLVFRALVLNRTTTGWTGSA